MRLKAAILSIAVGLCVSFTAHAATDTPVWEELTRKSSQEHELPTQQDVVEVIVKDGAVYITSAAPVKAEVFSILGQLITSKRIGEGTVRLNLKQRGVYILKAGQITKRINL